MRYPSWPVEFMRERMPCVGKTAAERFAAFSRNVVTSASSFLSRVSNGAVIAAFLSPPSLVFFRVERLGALWNRRDRSRRISSPSSSSDIRLANIFHGAASPGMFTVLECAADERLRRGHHFQMRQIADAALAASRPEGAVKDGQMLRLEAAGDSFGLFSSTSSIVSNFSMWAMMLLVSASL